MDALRSPVVTDADRKWALDQCPKWATIGGTTEDDELPEIVDEPAPRRAKSDVFRWDWFVADQAESFERFYRDDRKTADEWSNLWRRSWWPKADPRKRMPKALKKLIPTEPHPFARKGTPAFAAALKLATEIERAVFVRIGVAQFKPSDPRAKTLKAILAKGEAA